MNGQVMLLILELAERNRVLNAFKPVCHLHFRNVFFEHVYGGRGY